MSLCNQSILESVCPHLFQMCLLVNRPSKVVTDRSLVFHLKKRFEMQWDCVSLSWCKYMHYMPQISFVFQTALPGFWAIVRKKKHKKRFITKVQASCEQNGLMTLLGVMFSYHFIQTNINYLSPVKRKCVFESLRPGNIQTSLFELYMDLPEM